MSDSVLKLENTSIFQDKNLILSEINIDVKKGEFVYLIGKTGSGKSSLLKTLYGDLKLNHGKGEIVGFNLEALKDKKIPFLRRKLGIVFQDFKLLNERTVYGNLNFVLQATGWKEVEKDIQRNGDKYIVYVLIQFSMRNANKVLLDNIKTKENSYQKLKASQAFLELEEEVNKSS